MSTCDHTLVSMLVSGHTHTCNGAHLESNQGDLHKCSDPTCRRWFA